MRQVENFTEFLFHLFEFLLVDERLARAPGQAQGEMRNELGVYGRLLGLEHNKVAPHCAQVGVGLPAQPGTPCELDLLDRGKRPTESRIKVAKPPVLKSLETFEFRANRSSRTPGSGMAVAGNGSC